MVVDVCHLHRSRAQPGHPLIPCVRLEKVLPPGAVLMPAVDLYPPARRDDRLLAIVGELGVGQHGRAELAAHLVAERRIPIEDPRLLRTAIALRAAAEVDPRGGRHHRRDLVERHGDEWRHLALERVHLARRVGRREDRMLGGPGAGGERSGEQGQDEGGREPAVEAEGGFFHVRNSGAGRISSGARSTATIGGASGKSKTARLTAASADVSLLAARTRKTIFDSSPRAPFPSPEPKPLSWLSPAALLRLKSPKS